MVQRKFEEQAKRFCDAIRAMANNEYAINNFEDYLSIHFDIWLEIYAGTPEDIAGELKEFASIKER